MTEVDIIHGDSEKISNFQELVIQEYNGKSKIEAIDFLLKRIIGDTVGTIIPRQVYQGQEAFDKIDSIRKSIEDVILDETQKYTSFQWLWYIRRLPKTIFSGRLSSTRIYNLILAEHITAQSRKQGKAIPFGKYTFPMDKKSAKQLAKFAVMIDVLASIHVELRCAAKGSSYIFARGVFPRRIFNPEEEHAYEIYDRRVIENEASFSTIFGMDAISNEGDEVSLFPLLERSYDTEIRIPLSKKIIESISEELSIDKHTYHMPATFYPVAAFLDNIISILDEKNRKQLISHETAELFLASRLIYIFIAQSPETLIQIFRFGYIFVSEEYIRKSVAKYYAEAISETISIFGITDLPTDFNELIQKISVSSDKLIPVDSSPVLRHHNKSFAIDLYALSKRFLNSFDYSRLKGHVANIKGERFEILVQNEIIEAGFMSSEKILSMRGRHLKLNGKTLTDVDAFAIKDGELFLISCKSIIVNINYISGDYRTIRNITTSAAKYAEDWVKKVEAISQNPIGDNYDFTGFKISGLMCLPNVVYMPMGIGLSHASKGLYFISSLNEIIRWLTKSNSNVAYITQRLTGNTKALKKSLDCITVSLKSNH